MADQEKFEDWCHGIYVTDTMGVGWCVRIDGSSIMDDVGQYNCKPRHSFGLAKGLGNKEEAEAFARNWIKEQADKFGEARAEQVIVPTVQAGMEKPLDGWAITMQEGGNIFVESPSGDSAHVFMDDISPLGEVTRQLLQTLAFGSYAAPSQPVAGKASDEQAASIFKEVMQHYSIGAGGIHVFELPAELYERVKSFGTTANAGKASTNQPVQAKALTDERAAFEQHYRPRLTAGDLVKNGNGDYAIRDIHERWIGWQARALLASQPSAQADVAAVRIALIEQCAVIAEDEDHRVDARGLYDQLGDARGTSSNIAEAIRALKSAAPTAKPQADQAGGKA